MDKFSLWIGIFITLGTQLIFWIFSRRESLENKCLFFFVLLTTYIYSGIGIGYKIVEEKYIISYFLFLIFLCATIKIIFRYNFTFGRFIALRRKKEIVDLDYNKKLVTILTVLFILTSAMHLFIPNFNLIKFFRPGAPTSELIYAKRAATGSNTILKICSTINSMCFPFFCLFLKKLIDKRKKIIAMLLIMIWAYLNYLQYDYLSRYQILVFLAFAFCVSVFVYPEGIVVKRKYVIIAILGFILLVPFLNAYTAIRNGIDATIHFNAIGESLQELIETEIYYPTYYDVCERLYGTESVLNFIFWLICLPIPSVVFPGKPTVKLAYSFTYAISGLQYGEQEYYTSSLPSVVGEGIILLGPWFVGVYGIILGFFIGIYFKFIKKYRSLCVLHLYMVILMLTIGRGGASSYMSTLINGTFTVIIWSYFFKSKKKE